MRGQTSNVLRWPLWSWRNLSVTVAGVLLVFYGMGRVVEPAKIPLSKSHVPLVAASPALSQPAGPAPTAPSPVPATASTPAISRVAVADRKDSVTRVAAAFAHAWCFSTRSQREWTQGIQPFVTPALAAGLAQTDPARVPATKVTGEAALVTASATSAQVRVSTDGGGIVVTLLRTLSGPWQVSDVGPAGQPPGAPTPDLHAPASAARN